MLRSVRFHAVLLSSVIVFAAGCEKSSTSGTGGSGDVKAGYGSTNGTGKKLVGIWEGSDDDMKDKDGKPAKITVEFKADGKTSMTMGPFELAGTWKVAKEEGKTLTVDTEMSLADFPGKDADKSQKKSFTLTFENDDTIVMTPTDKKDLKTLKRKK